MMMYHHIVHRHLKPLDLSQVHRHQNGTTRTIDVAQDGTDQMTAGVVEEVEADRKISGTANEMKKGETAEERQETTVHLSHRRREVGSAGMMRDRMMRACEGEVEDSTPLQSRVLRVELVFGHSAGVCSEH